MADSSIIFETKLDNKALEKDLEKAKRTIRSATESIYKNEQRKLPLVKQSQELSVVLDQAKAKLYEMQKAPIGTFDKSAISEQKMYVTGIQREYTRIENEIDRINRAIDKSNIDLDLEKKKAGQIQVELAKAANEADRMDENTKESSRAMQQLEKRTRRFGSRMREIISGALFFNIISRGMTLMVQWTGNVIKTNDDARESIAQLKGALLTLAQPILNVVIPAFVSLVNILARVIAAIASVVSRLFGTTVQKSADAAKKLNQQATAYGDVGDAAKEAAKSIMGFDEINSLQGDMDTGSAGGSSSSDTIVPQFDTTLADDIQEEADRIVGIGSALIFAVGAILAFSGFNIPLGIGMMAIGALGMYSVASLKWDTMNKEVKNVINTLMVTLGLSLLVIGAILAFSGTKIGLGIGLMALGAAALGSAVALNWNFLPDNIKYVIATILGVLAAGLLVIGAILLFTGHPVLGLGLMIAGGLAMWGAGADLNWNYAKEQLMGAWNGIKSWFSTNVAPKLTLSYWQEKLSSIGDAAGDIGDSIREGFSDALYNTIASFSDFLATILEGLQWLVDQAASVFDFISTTSSLGQAFSNGYVAPANSAPYSAEPYMASVPALARGAVIPPNREFLAVLGDQTSGNNIEAPEGLIRQIIREELEGGNNDNILVIIELLRQILSKCGLRIDGEDISRMVTRYQREMERAGGW